MLKVNGNQNDASYRDSSLNDSNYDGASSPLTAIESNGNPIHIARREIQWFLKRHSGYDVLPLSFQLMVLDTELLVKKALAALVQNGICNKQ